MGRKDAKGYIFFEIIIEVINEIGRDKIKSITERFKSDANVICR